MVGMIRGLRSEASIELIEGGCLMTRMASTHDDISVLPNCYTRYR
jgi:hypothetical protein